MKRILFILPSTLLCLSLIVGCQARTEKSGTLAAARQGFQTKPKAMLQEREPVEEPPANLFQIVRYDSSIGKLPAYLTPSPGDGRKHPAIVWVTGGDCNSIGDVWSPQPASNDQSARAFREAGIAMMFPSFRGGNENPGQREGFFHEIDDVLAATDFLAKLDYVDPNRIYLGGHSSGGTFALLTAEISSRYRAVFSLGPVCDPSCYPPEYIFFDTSNPREAELRSPDLWLHCITNPVFVFEGTAGRNNSTSVQSMAKISTNPKAQFILVPGGDHFSIIAPTTRFLAKKILEDTGSTCNISIKQDEVNRLMGR